jgi:hypothetical protein
VVAHDTHLKDERTSLGDSAAALARKLMIAGIVALVLSLVAGLVTGGFGEVGVRRFLFAYLIGYLFSLSISIGALGFLLFQFSTRAGWSATVRRIGEVLAAAMPTMLVLAIPVFVSVALNNGYLYRWAQPVAHHDDHGAEHADADSHGAEAAHPENAGHDEPAPEVASEDAALVNARHQNMEVALGDVPDYAKPIAQLSKQYDMDATKGVPPMSHLTAAKTGWLNPWYFIVRVVIYLAILGWIGRWFLRLSLEQDETGDVELSVRRQVRAPGLLVVSCLAVTFIGFDLIMSLDPDWYSTIFGGFYFGSACMVAFFATLILVAHNLQKRGYLTQSVTVEHYHDMGKLLFAFNFFWGYIAFSQYLLLWYAQIPETLGWLDRRGATFAENAHNSFGWIGLILLFGHLLIPFAGLLSRHVKRNKGLLPFWAVWLLVAHFFDIVWLVLPEYSEHVIPHIPEILAVAGVGGVFFASAVKLIGTRALRPLRDPRLPEALAFQNI